MPITSISEAMEQLSALIERVLAGDEIIIGKAGKPVAKLVPVTSGGGRTLGIDEGRFEVPADFDAPLPDDVIRAFESES